MVSEPSVERITIKRHAFQLMTRAHPENSVQKFIKFTNEEDDDRVDDDLSIVYEGRNVRCSQVSGQVYQTIAT